MPATATRQHAAQAARMQAVKRLIAVHQDEFDAMLGEERAARGLPANPSAVKLTAQAERVRAQLQQLEQKLAALNGQAQ